MILLDEATKFARDSHAGQSRKYTHEPYIRHPIAVATMVQEFFNETAADISQEELTNALCAAVLHDVVEDCGIGIEEIAERFGDDIAAMVWFLSDPPKFVGNRAKRKELTNCRLREAPAIVRLIKVMDIAHNSASIKEHDPKFYKTFIKEKRNLFLAMDVINLKVGGVDVYPYMFDESGELK